MTKPKRLNRTLIYESQWVTLYRDRVAFPGGRIVEAYHIVEFGGEGVGAIVENENREILLIQSYRYTTDSIEWEIPAGGRDQNESITETAIRETLEETGYHTTNHELIYSFYPIIGISGHRFHIVKCRVVGENTGTFDTNEVKGYRWFSQAELRQMIRDGLIQDGLALTGLMIYFFS